MEITAAVPSAEAITGLTAATPFVSLMASARRRAPAWAAASGVSAATTSVPLKPGPKPSASRS